MNDLLTVLQVPLFVVLNSRTRGRGLHRPRAQLQMRPAVMVYYPVCTPKPHLFTSFTRWALTRISHLAEAMG
jgi:hypothetical protein